MLQAVYQTSPYIFKLQTQDVSKVDVTATASTSGTTACYLFKFTNQMNGGVKYAFGMVSSTQLNPLISENRFGRYSTFYFFHNTTDNWLNGDIDFLPNGHWDYEVIEYSVDVMSLASTQNLYNQVPDLDSGYIGSYKIYQTSEPDVLVTSSDINLPDLSDASSSDVYINTPATSTSIAAETYTANLYRKDGTSQYSTSFTIATYNFAIALPAGAPLAIESLKQTATGVSFNIVCKSVSGWNYKYRQGTGGFTNVPITSASQTDSYAFSLVTAFDSDDNRVEIQLYSDPTYVPNPNALQYTSYVIPIPHPFTSYGFIHPLAYEPAITGTFSRNGGLWWVMSLGYSLDATNKVRNIYQKKTEILDGLLYVEPAGTSTDQVKYTEYKNATLGGFIINYVGSGYSSAPTVTISGGGGAGATATASVSGGKLTGITITNAGNGYTSTPNVILTGGGATQQAEVLATLEETNYIFYGQ